jgi:DNA-binding NarL/FixJ family response regulator
MNELVLVATQRVYIIDNNVNALGIRMLFQAMIKEVQICGGTNNFPAAYDQIGKIPKLPDLLVADINLGGGATLEPIKQLSSIYPKLRILVLSAEDEKLYAIRALRAGAVGYVLKSAPFDFMVSQIRLALTGKSVVSPEISSYMAENMVGRVRGELTVASIDSLSDREYEVLNMLSRGLGTREIAQALHLSIKTIESHRQHIKDKLNLKDAAELTRFAYTFKAEIK